MEEIKNIEKNHTEAPILPLLPLKNVVILPKSIIPIMVGRPSSIAAVEYALKHDKVLFISAQKEQKTENPTIDDVFQVGTRSTILQVGRMPNGALKILAEGICRAKVICSEDQEDFLGVEIADLPTKNAKNSAKLEAHWRQLKELYRSYVKLNDKAPSDLITMIKTPQEIDYVADTIAVHINLSFDERQEILETIDLHKRILKLCGLLKKEIEILQIEQSIRSRIHEQIEKSHREYY